MTMDEIIAIFDLKEYSQKRKFKIFATSMKTGENVPAVIDF